MITQVQQFQATNGMAQQESNKQTIKSLYSVLNDALNRRLKFYFEILQQVDNMTIIDQTLSLLVLGEIDKKPEEIHHINQISEIKLKPIFELFSSLSDIIDLPHQINPRTNIHEKQILKGCFLVNNYFLKLSFRQLQLCHLNKSNKEKGLKTVFSLVNEILEGYFLNFCLSVSNNTKSRTSSCRANIELSKLRYLSSLVLPKIQEVNIKVNLKPYMNIKRRSRSAQAYQEFESKQKLVNEVHGEEVIIERDICFNFKQKMVITHKKVENTRSHRSNSIKSTSDQSPKKRHHQSPSQENIFLGDSSINNQIQKVGKQQSDVLGVLKNDKQRKLGHLFKMVQNKGVTSQDSDTSSVESEISDLTQSRIATQKIAAHIYQTKRTSIIENLKFRRLAPMINLKEKYQVKVYHKLKALILLMVLATVFSALYYYKHNESDL